MSKKATKKNTIRLGNKTRTVEVDIFGNNGPTNYSGFGVHMDKNRRQNRYKRNQEERNARLWGKDVD